MPVALALIIGGIVILAVDRREGSATVREVKDLTPLTAAKLGLCQMVALFPGTSRSGATIVGGVLFGLSRKAATEFSFFLAIPTLLGATAYKLIESWHLFTAATFPMLLLSSLGAFMTALLAVRGFIRFIANHSFAAFAWYRIVFGAIVLVTAYYGYWGR